MTCDGRHDFIRNHLHIYSESTAILDLLQSPFQPWCCVTLIWPNRPCIKLSPRRMRPRVGTRPRTLVIVLPLLYNL
jgi:hypothetical protein